MGDLKQILRMVSPDECQALQDICEYNDITEEQLVSAPETIKSVEMFMHTLPRICCMSFFPNLVSLSLVQQNLGGIHGLHNCPYLEVLRLNENHIQRIEGLDGCFRLKELYLHSNQISQVRNISHLSSLEVLWLANNQIKKVEGLENLARLRELNLACNTISQLGDIVNLKLLEHLNIAATGIGSFKEIGNLTRLKFLRDLRFADPNWGSSPIALLHNYQTYILFRMQQLIMLDSQDMAEELKQAAKATYTRKRVYYNMCIKSLQHNRENIASLSVKCESRRARSLQKTLAKLFRNQKDLRQQMKQAHEFQEAFRSTKTSFVGLEQSRRQDWWHHSKSMVTTLENQISHVMARLDTLREDMHIVRAKERAAVERKIHWLKLELDTGGNIRMEIGNPRDVWFKNCDNLVTSRFSLLDYSPFGITGVRVLKVIRIHNRFLQDRWEKSFEGKVVKSRKKHVEYLLYGETLQCADEFQCIVEEGFPYLPGQSNHGCHGPVLLSNSIGLADVRRLQVIAEQLQTESPWNIKAPGWVLVVKAYLGCSVQDLTVNLASPAAKKSTYPGADSVYRLHPSDPVQRSWFVFESTLVVPEYLVEFQYTYHNENGGEITQRISARQKRMLFTSECESDKDRGSWKCIPFTDPIQTVAAKGSITVNHSPRHQRSRRIKLSEKSILLTNDLILKNHTVHDFSKVLHLNIHNYNIDEIDALKSLVHLKVPGLQSLNMRNNPLEEEFSYRQVVSRHVPSLLILDSLPISTEERVDESYAKQFYVIANSFSEWKFTFPTILGGHDDLAKTRGQTPGHNPWQMLEPKVRILNRDEAWFDEIEELHLEDQKLQKMESFGKLPNLRRLLLSNNDISTIEDIESCTLLEELILDNNHIEQVKGIPPLQSLWKLDLSRNYLTSCAHLHGFGALTQLSIERNYIQSLKGLSGLICLMELYAANNQISDMRDLLHIRELPKLMVVDLSGNALCQCSEYRTYSIYSMKKLKVLDGRIVTSSEVAQAREKHIGRLTRESLEERLGRSSFNGVEVVANVLDLSGRSLRHCGDVFENKDIQELTELNLSNNFLSHVHGLQFLRNLVVLRIENNNIENGPLLDISLPVFHSSSTSVGDQQIITSCHSHEVTSYTYTGLENVECLQLARNAISSIFSLQLRHTFANLKSLSLQDNRITKLDGLDGLLFLEKLFLDHNSIKEIEPSSFAGLYNLKVLHLSDNVLRALSHMEHLTSLETLDLASNYLTSNRLGGLSSIDCLTRMPNLVDLSLANNPMSRQPFYRIGAINKLRQLQYLDGKEIFEFQDEREEADIFSTGNNKESFPVLDGSGLVDVTAIPGKVPIKVTAMNFENMCGPPTSPRHGNGSLNCSTLGSIFNSGSTISASKPQMLPTVNNSLGQRFWELSETRHIIQKNELSPCRGRGSKVDTSKVIVVPVLLMKNLKNVRDRTMFDSLK
ncbi:flagellar associated protein 234 [Selaginella moellendorffii]|uniref:Flagellar associated protein 234 n=1 Tax=Selaginella moellendorffii TaxID=88036 RepID=D8T0V7_SELML|nr:flagellar associated protein 234 [Selaginella moellendorffii]